MFAEMIAVIQNKGVPEPHILQKRYDFAMTKKMGIVKLPPAFWMQDPKINPRSDHLFWAALLLKDRNRIDMALSVIAVELAETISMKGGDVRQSVDSRASALVEELLAQIADASMRHQLEQELNVLIPEYLSLHSGKP